jgi:heme oxygenase
MLLDKLREKTKPYHREIEKNVLLRKLMGPLTLLDYIEILKKFYGFYLPLETQTIPKFLNQNNIFQKFSFPKLPLLKRDLDALGLDDDALKLCPCTPNPATSFGCLGVLYTLEGSCLGRAMMWPHIQQQLRLDCGGSFFGTASPGLQTHWADFCKGMNEQVLSGSEVQEVIDGAIATFVTLDEWFKQ